MKRNVLSLILLGFLFVAPALPATIVTNPDPLVFAGLISDQVTGADLAGLVVTATYNTPGSPTIVTSVRMPTDLVSGAASTPAVSISVTGNASNALAWRYQSIFLSPLASLDFDGSAAGIYFDRAHSGPDTPGSGSGADISFGRLIPSGVDSQFVVTYSRAVSLNGTSPQNDLYAKLTIIFGSGPYGGLIPQDFSFTQPMDRNVTPEPTSSWLILTGFAVVILVCRPKVSTSVFLKAKQASMG